jgi:hypothetical protein
MIVCCAWQTGPATGSFVATHISVVQARPSSQDSGDPEAQAPAWQVSEIVQGLPSLHGVPLVAGECQQPPGSAQPSLVQGLLSLHDVGLRLHVPSSSGSVQIISTQAGSVAHSNQPAQTQIGLHVLHPASTGPRHCSEVQAKLSLQWAPTSHWEPAVALPHVSRWTQPLSVQ